ncbi:hypothetical protein CASFOL_019343 [Castilleja foliolosa]|uniref:KIB1-4 beta-propeller domain-containing protein n=1 Tax=Castilleja foliolosa TaxID=1961234 RepID=A0ABD3D755_9LAMI
MCKNWTTNSISFLKKALPVISYKIANSTRWISHKVNYYSTRCMSTISTNTRLDSPWLMLPPTFKDDDEMVYNFYSLSENKVLSFNKRDPKDRNPTLSPPDDSKIVGSSQSWLALFDTSNCDLYLSNPLTRRHIKLPPIHNLLPIQEAPKGGYGCVSKLIISCSPHENECRAIISFDSPTKLAFCSLGTLTTDWKPISTLFLKYHYDDRNYEDFVYSARQKLFFCLTDVDAEDLEGWDLTDPNSPRVDWFDEYLLKEEYSDWLSEKDDSLMVDGKYYFKQVRYLVFSEESNRLFLVTRHVVEQMAPDGSYVEDSSNKTYPYKTIDIDVHEIDREGRRTIHMEGCLDGMSMFVGLNHSFLISGAGARDWIKPDCIYFTDDKELTPPKWRDRTFGGHNIGIFDYGNKTISSCYYPCDIKSLKRIMPAPMWFTPSLH